MKSLKLRKILSLVLAITLTFTVFAVAVSAALEDNASAFNSAVSRIKSATTLESKESNLKSADTAIAAYIADGGSVTDAAINDSYAYYSEVKPVIEASVKACNDFVEYVALALVETNTFVETKGYLDLAEALLDKIDLKYGDVSLMKTEYDKITDSLVDPIKVCEDFISYASMAAAATNYKDANTYYTLASNAKTQIEILDYPGLDEAEANLAIASATMANATLAAKPFLDAVRNIGKADSTPLGIKAAKDALKGIDQTAPGVANALKNLEKADRWHKKGA